MPVVSALVTLAYQEVQDTAMVVQFVSGCSAGSMHQGHLCLFSQDHHQKHAERCQLTPHPDDGKSLNSV